MGKVVRVGTEGYVGETGEAIQRAIDDLAAAGGGTVEVPAGIYRLNNAVRLRSNIRLLGEKGTVLLKMPSVSSPIRGFLGYGHFEFAVEEPDLFPVGTGIHLSDNNSGGFYNTVATITERRGDYFLIDRMLNHDYHGTQGGNASSLFSLVEVCGVENVAVENLTLDGNPEETRTLNGCRGGGVFLLGARDIRLKDLEIRNYRGDALSFQQCVDVRVQACYLHDNTGHGLHPGSGSVRYTLENCRIEDNGGCGIFYCLRTTHSRCAGNRIERNGSSGISLGERDTDHTIEGNVIQANGGEAIDFRGFSAQGADRVLIRSNVLGPNRRERGEAEIFLPGGLADIAIIGNTFETSGEAVHTTGAVQRLVVTDLPPGDLAAYGPALLPLDGARHLGIAELPPWRAE